MTLITAKLQVENWWTIEKRNVNKQNNKQEKKIKQNKRTAISARLFIPKRNKYQFIRLETKSCRIS